MKPPPADARGFGSSGAAKDEGDVASANPVFVPAWSPNTHPDAIGSTAPTPASLTITPPAFVTRNNALPAGIRFPASGV